MQVEQVTHCLPLMLESEEHPPCPLCAKEYEGIVVGRKGRFGMAVRNVACPDCGLVYVSPRPTPAVMDAYYRGQYREQYRDIKLPTGDGRFVGPDDPEGYANAREFRYRTQAMIALQLGGSKAGDQVLEVGCRNGRTLALMRDLGGVIPQGIEPGPEQNRDANAAGVPCFLGLLEEFDAEGRSFDQVQMFHVLEHMHEPLAMLLALRKLLKENGRLLLEVPNVYSPYGLLEENFFQNAHLLNFSPVTLPALVRRAGFRVLSVGEDNTLFVVATPDPAAEELPVPFHQDMLSHPEQQGEWVAVRLQTYAKLEKIRHEFLSTGGSLELLEQISVVLQKPGFTSHLTDVVCGLVEHLARGGAMRAAYILASTASLGPHDKAVTEGFARLAEALIAPIKPGQLAH